MKSIHKIIVNRIKYIFFLINEKFNGDHIVKKLKKIDKIYSLKVKIKKLDNLSKKYPAHPMITSLMERLCSRPRSMLKTGTFPIPVVSRYLETTVMMTKIVHKIKVCPDSREFAILSSSAKTHF